MSLRQTQRDFSRPSGPLLGNPINMYRGTTIPVASFTNSTRLDDLVKDGKIYLSLSDALALAIENNYDIAIARYNLDIADTDVLRSKAGATLRGVNSGVVANTIGGSVVDSDRGRRPGRHVRRIRRRGFGPWGPGVLDRQRRPAAGRPGSCGCRHHPVGKGQGAPVEHVVLWRQIGSDHQYQCVQLHVQPGLCHRHRAAGGFQQQPCHERQPVRELQSRV